MARARVDINALGEDERVKRQMVLDASRMRVQRWRERLRAEQEAQQNAGARHMEQIADDSAATTTIYDPVQLTAEELAAAQEIINAALQKARVLTAEDALAALIKSQQAEIAEAQRMGHMPKWYNGTPVTLFIQPPYEHSRLADNDTDRPRIKNLIDYQLPYVRELSGDQIQAVREFQDGVRWNVQQAVGVYQVINRCLRGIPEPSYSQWQSDVALQNVNKNMRLMDSAINTLRVPENIFCYRGIRGPGIYPNKGTVDSGNFARDFATWKLGEIRSDPGFVSTTLSRRVANEMFTAGHDDGSTEPYVIEYRVPTGTMAACMNAVNPRSKFADTVELVIGRDTQFRVIAKYDDTTRTGQLIHRAVLDILPPHEQAGRRPLPTYKLT